MKLERLIFNGKLITKDKLNFIELRRGFLYGDGIFETLISRNYKIFRFDEHWERLKKGAEICNFKVPNKIKLENLIVDELKRIKWKECYIRINLWRKKPYTFAPFYERQTNYLVIIRKLNPYPENFYKEGIKSIISNKVRRNEQSVLSKIKSFNYLENIILKIEGEKEKSDEIIVLNTMDYIAEGSISNIFFVKKGIIYTPSLKCGCLEGITRKIILEICKKEKIQIREGCFKVNFLIDTDEVFMTNTLMGIMPVREIKGYFKSKKFDFTEILIKKYKEIFEEETE